ncbi:metalloproteinase inhibitor 1-like [Crassostrea virginica]
MGLLAFISKRPAERMGLRGYLICILLLCDFHFTLCCDCFPSHIQTDFCAASFVIRAKVYYQEELQTPDGFDSWLRYGVNISTVFKGHEHFLLSNRALISTPGPAHSCGPQELIQDQEYLILGYKDETALRASSCSGVKFWKDIYTELIRNIDCACKVFTPRTWSLPNTQDPSPAKTDELCIAPNRGTCSFKSGVCKRDPNGICHWSLVEPCVEP